MAQARPKLTIWRPPLASWVPLATALVEDDFGSAARQKEEVPRFPKILAVGVRWRSTCRRSQLWMNAPGRSEWYLRHVGRPFIDVYFSRIDDARARPPAIDEHLVGGVRDGRKSKEIARQRP